MEIKRLLCLAKCCDRLFLTKERQRTQNSSIVPFAEVYRAEGSARGGNIPWVVEVEKRQSQVV